MKLFKLFAAAAACIALFASCNPEGKGEQKEDYSAIQKQLAGTWEGELKTIVIVNGEEKELGSTKVVLTFTDKTMTRKDGEEVALTYDYVLKKDSSKGYYFVCSLKGEEIGVREMRRHVMSYVHGMRGAAALRRTVNSLTRLDALLDTICRFFEETEPV